jgi:peptide/nickel transport system substrate-binding protein
VKEGEAVVLERNPDYWGKDEDGNSLPYLDGIRISFIKEKKQEFVKFKNEELDMIFGIPIENIRDILGDFERAKESKPFQLQIVPAMGLFYFGYLHALPPFNDKRVCLAFNYAIDREKIVKYVLQGDGIPANYGVVPPSPTFIKMGYDTSKINGYICLILISQKNFLPRRVILMEKIFRWLLCKSIAVEATAMP